MIDIVEFVRERNEALMSLDKKKIEAYCRKYGVRLPEEETVFWASIHKARLQIVSLPLLERNKSIAWLLDHGFSSEIF